MSLGFVWARCRCSLRSLGRGCAVPWLMRKLPLRTWRQHRLRHPPLALLLPDAAAITVGRAILPAAGFQPAGPAGKRVRSQDWLPHIGLRLSTTGYPLDSAIRADPAGGAVPLDRAGRPRPAAGR